MYDDRRLIEDYLPIKAISAEASREKSVRKGHISTLHLWWARRPLVACRAAVYGTLVPASRFIPENGPDNKKQSLGRANAAKFVTNLCKYPGNPSVIKEAERHILEAHAERLTKETGQKVTREDIEQGRAPRPKVLDMFAGGGAIPLEALRLGCEAYALDLNPVAHIIELCTLVYPQKYGKPDPNAKGMTGPRNEHGETTWGGLAEEVKYWGNWVLEKVRKEIGDLYPPIPDPEAKPRDLVPDKQSEIFPDKEGQQKLKAPGGYLTPVAYLWTRTVRCKNPSCGATVPLVKQTWLCKKKGRYVALKIVTGSTGVAPVNKKVRFEVVEATTEKGLGFDPSLGSKGGNATCPFCGTVADSSYVKAEGCAKRMGEQMMGVVASKAGPRGWVYLSADEIPVSNFSKKTIYSRIDRISQTSSITVPGEILEGKCTDQLPEFGMSCFSDLFSPRQMLFLMSSAAAIRSLHLLLQKKGLADGHRKAIITMLGLVIDRAADFGNALCVWNAYKDSGTTHVFGRQALPMVWDYSETNPFNTGNASWTLGIDRITSSLLLADFQSSGQVERGSATNLPWPSESFDCVITDPPYYDNIQYADLSDFFYVWLKRMVGHLYPEHFTGNTAPKKKETVASPFRHAGNKEEAKKAYETMMAQSLAEAHRILKRGGEIVIVYAHKTTLGWSTLIDALRRTGFTVSEAWPLDTEKPGRLLAQNTAALASSIFLVARKRNGTGTGAYENEVKLELEQIVRERVDSLWKMGITGADLVIAAVGAGLRAFTRFSRVEYANGEEVPAERFLAEVETMVLENILKRLSKEVGGNGSHYSLAGVDPATRFYILWRYTYKYSVLDAGEAIVFANGTHVELDGPNGLSTGAGALLEKKKGKYRLKDYTDRGPDKKLGQKMEDGQPAPMIDALHRTLWLMENRPAELPTFLQEAQPNREQMRLVAQALAGPALKGGELGDLSPQAEMSALSKLTANWRSVIEDSVLPIFQKGKTL